MTDHDAALLRIADVASAHARNIISAVEAAEIYDSVASAMNPVCPEIAEAARTAAALLREGQRAELRVEKLFILKDEELRSTEDQSE